MSLYNALHGENPIVGPLLEMLQLKREDFGRFRDVHLMPDDTIRVLTRNGTYVEYEPILNKLKAHPNYKEHYIDNFDGTFLYIIFYVPEQYKTNVLALLREKQPDTLTVKEKLDDYLAKIEKGEEDIPKSIESIFKQIGEGKGGIFKI